MSTNPNATRRRSKRNSAPAAGNSAGNANGTLRNVTDATTSNNSPGGSVSVTDSTQSCPFFARGQCRYGDRCKWRHESRTVVATSISPSTSASIEVDSKSEPQRSTQRPFRMKPCFAWRKGSCAKGDQCPYAHAHVQGQTPCRNLVPQSVSETTVLATPNGNAEPQGLRQLAVEQEAARQDQEQENERKTKVAREAERRQELARKRTAALQKKKKELELEAKRKVEETLALEKVQLRQLQALIAQKHRADALVTIQRIQFGSTIVTFSAGANIDLVIPGFETCRVTIRNIPLGIQMNQLWESIQGDDETNNKGKIHVVSLKRWNQAQEGTVIADGEVGKDVARRLNSTNLKGQILKIEVDQTGGAAGMNSRRNGVSLKISWRAPSSRYAITCRDMLHANEMVRQFNGTSAFGRKVRAEHDTGCRNVGKAQVLVSGLPGEIADTAVQDFFQAAAVRRISILAYDDVAAKPQLKACISDFCTSRYTHLPEFDEPLQTDPTADRIIFARFDEWHSAKQLHDFLVNRKFHWIGNSSFRLWLPDPIQYEISIPFNQYQVQFASWKTLLSNTVDKRDLNLRIIERREKEKVFIHVGGTGAKAVGMLRVRVENLSAGEKLGYWHRSFILESGQLFFRSLISTTGALVVPDRRLKIVRAYGESAAVEKARNAVSQEIERLARQEYTVILKRSSIRFFVQRGVASLKERFGEETVSLDISSSPCRITIRGGEDAQHALHSLIEQSIHEVLPVINHGDSNAPCPICLDEISAPVQFSCGHQYCSACAQHFFTADVKNFPMICVGDGAQCRAPVALPIIQNFLTEAQFNSLLEAAFVQYVEKNPNMFKYCPTPDCERLYRCTPRDTPGDQTRVCCPSCMSGICSRCHEDHEGLTCDERQRARNDQVNNEDLNTQWAKTTGVKKCPACDVWIEKTEGCNHISCKCGVHICWSCMGTFEAHDIYDHMRERHGGIGINDGVIHNVDYVAQARELEMWNTLAARRLERAPYQHLDAVPAPRVAPEVHHRRVADLAEQHRIEQLYGQRLQDMQATRRRARQEEGGNWCTIM
ncbi:hypothetical protein BDP27DRAFT_1287385 [Rhodocollybia butyracea]|uniref:RBR-type E3 ubiquitin transferase n=1 Tax=Rhodocollybia butyracea TaxID=206335 RepID=A0A9P5Q3W5_9AGAR|nr:hypothetical protein BDP27DRAFT_1287385 [Rhodocollybia butyracea]